VDVNFRRYADVNYSSLYYPGKDQVDNILDNKSMVCAQIYGVYLYLQSKHALTFYLHHLQQCFSGTYFKPAPYT
jgi:hypothetical protein